MCVFLCLFSIVFILKLWNFIQEGGHLSNVSLLLSSKHQELAVNFKPFIITFHRATITFHVNVAPFKQLHKKPDKIRLETDLSLTIIVRTYPHTHSHNRDNRS